MGLCASARVCVRACVIVRVRLPTFMNVLARRCVRARLRAFVCGGVRPCLGCLFAVVACVSVACVVLRLCVLVRVVGLYCCVFGVIVCCGWCVCCA